MEGDADRGGGRPYYLGDLLMAEAGKAAQEQYLALVMREFGDGPFKPDQEIFRLDLLGRPGRGVGTEELIRDLFEGLAPSPEMIER